MASNVSNTSPGNTYASKTKSKISPLTNFLHPSDEQGLVFAHKNDYKVRDYLMALKDLVKGPKNIIAAARVSNNRIIVFLSTKELAEEFLIAHGGITLDSQFIKGRKLGNTRKLIFSNVSPVIPNDILENHLKTELKLELASNLSILRVSPTDDLFSHVVSWRRQVYCKIDDRRLTHLPSSFLFHYGDKTHRIFITYDEFVCFKCHKQGHKADDCPSLSEDTVELGEDTAPEQSLNQAVTNGTQEESLNSPPLLPALQTTNSLPVLMDTTYTQNGEVTKRRLPSSSNSSQQPSVTRRKRKKPKKTPLDMQQDEAIDPSSYSETEEDQSTSNMEVDKETLLSKSAQRKQSLKTIFQPLQEKFATRTYPIKSIENFALFIDMYSPAADMTAILKNFTDDTKGVIDMLQELYPDIHDHSTKIRFTKISTKLQEGLSPLTVE